MCFYKDFFFHVDLNFSSLVFFFFPMYHLRYPSQSISNSYWSIIVIHYPCWSVCNIFFFPVFGFRIYVIGEGHSCDILCDPSSIIGCKAGNNINGCISGLPTDLAGNLFACRWVGCCWTSKIHIFSIKMKYIYHHHLHICIQIPVVDLSRDRKLYEINQ